jgi:NAD(P)-dependent dehydrogenase (short-subunit alcohol dehydrogenase family)
LDSAEPFRATAHAFAELGASVALTARSEESLREVAEECEAAGGRALVVPTDVTNQDSVQELARRTVEGFGRIDVWVNNAGVILYGRFEKTPAGAYQRVIETNLFGQIHGARAALAHFRERGSGVLINLSSVWGRLTSPYVSAYVTSKFAIRAFSECLRQELAGEEDIHVVTSPLRAPFTEYQEMQSPSNVEEQPRGTGLRKAIGELMVCIFCLGQWVAAFFAYGLVLAPAVTRFVAAIYAILTVSDYLHQAYMAVIKEAQ